MSRTNTQGDGKQKQYFFTSSNTEFDFQTEAWEVPYIIDDADLTFDGTPLNMLYERNRYVAEGHVTSHSHESKSHDASYPPPMISLAPSCT